MNIKVEQPRVVSGNLKNLKLEVPANARPMTERVKIVLFDTIKDIISNSSILDLFAGSGNVGIEALSRGAKLAIFVDSDKEAFEILKRNLKKVELEKSSHKIFNLDYKEFVKTYTGNFDIIFLDPPFKIHTKINLSDIMDLLAEDGYIIYKVEEKQRAEIRIPESLDVLLEKKVGINTLLFLKKSN